MTPVFQHFVRSIIVILLGYAVAVGPAAAGNWQDVIRSLPYAYSKDYHRNLSTIRRWVLLENGFCDVAERHVLFNDRGVFLTFTDNAEDKETTQRLLNDVRAQLQQSGKVNRWIEGSESDIGYPFALNCHQPHVNVDEAFSRLVGDMPSDLIWGTWDGLSLGTENDPVPLLSVVDSVYQTKSKIIGQPIVAAEFRYFLGQIIIESGASKDRLSVDNAIGMLQLKPSVLQDCEIPERFYRHRMAQVDCAVRLFQQNRRNLLPAFESVFGNIESSKKDTVFSMLLVQSYHSGIGRVMRLLSDPERNQAALHFAQFSSRYSAEDIGTGLIYHNLGRDNFGFASLYYVVDVAIIAEQLCQLTDVASAWFCKDVQPLDNPQ